MLTSWVQLCEREPLSLHVVTDRNKCVSAPASGDVLLSSHAHTRVQFHERLHQFCGGVFFFVCLKSGTTGRDLCCTYDFGATIPAGVLEAGLPLLVGPVPEPGVLDLP